MVGDDEGWKETDTIHECVCAPPPKKKEEERKKEKNPGNPEICSKCGG